MVNSSPGRAIRVLAIVEGTKISGPAKNVLEFCRVSRDLDARPGVATSVAAFVRRRKDGNPEVESNQILEAVAAMDLEVHSIPERFPFDPQVVRELRNLVRRLDPDIIQTHHTKSHFLVRLSGLQQVYRWIAFHHGYTDEGTKMRLYDQLDRWSLRAPLQVITVCEAFKRQLVSRGVAPARIVVLHNAISLNWLDGREHEDTPAIPAAHDFSNNVRGQERVVLAVGRLSGEKAFADLIVAVNQLRQLQPHLIVRLVIVGDGPERGRLEQAIRDHGLQDRVTLTGHVRDVRPYYRSADVLAISSVSEGSPNALLEAMASGVPVVATAVGGIPEIVTDKETGLLIAPRDPQAMASSLNLLFSDSDLARTLAIRAQELIRNQYSPQDRARFLLELYQKVSLS